ncbi:MAG: alpha/beta hydrolase [Clostridia bacterium]|nr:alpha/beta hydrolase [Clostridia bacterium]MBP3649782.1 alpha/beta hydrolase [Clostridia bacterium]
MTAQRITIAGIPALIWGEESEKVYLCVHGKMSDKESAAGIAALAAEKGYQTISFDLPQHGERKNEERRCDIWNGKEDLTRIGEYVFERWREVSLYACSLGAYFSLHAYADRPFRRCLFQSPILDMEYLIRQMFQWFDITEEKLAQEKEIDTPIDLMSWDYFQYVVAHPITRWNSPTCILYGEKDDLQSLSVIRSFADQFDCHVTLAENSQHPFMEEADFPIVDRWLKDYLFA